MNVGFGKILDESLAERVKHSTDRATDSFFRGPREGERSRRSQSFTRWVAAPLEDESNDEGVRAVADTVADELLTTTSTVMRDLIVGTPHLLATMPMWSDGAPLFASSDPKGKKSRFTVVGGNCMATTGDQVRDLKRAYARLAMLNVKHPFERGEQFRIYCSFEQAPALEAAKGSVRFSYDVVPQRALEANDPWILTRDRPVAVVRIARPTMETPDYDGVIYGTMYEVWLDDPSGSVRMRNS